jgi:hypothetical protein
MRGGLKVVSGKEVVDILAGFGFVTIGGTKHFKGRRRVETRRSSSPFTTWWRRVPGAPIFVLAPRYVLQQELRSHFYNE